MMPGESVDKQLLDLFFAEVAERTGDLEQILLALETSDPGKQDEHLAALLRKAHSLKGAAGLAEAREIEAACHWMEDMIASVRAGEVTLVQPLIEKLLAKTDAVAETGRIMQVGGDPADGPLRKEARKVSHRQRRSEAKDSPVQAAGSLPPPRLTDVDGSVRVPADRLDSLLFRSEELLVARMRAKARVEEFTTFREAVRQYMAVNMPGLTLEKDGPEAWFDTKMRELQANITEDSRLLENATRLLDNEVRRARMQPFSQTCGGLHRMVRDLCSKLGKSAKVVVVGGTVEMDRSIIGGLHDAIRHLVRNAVDHGIETPDIRLAADKSPSGTITVAAEIRGDRLRVRVSDDGRGIDWSALRRRLAESSGANNADERSLYLQLFTHGYSTAESITDISGRGVGLEIVKKAVESLRGIIEVSDNIDGGATFTLALPLSLTATRAVFVKASDHTFAIDTASIRRVANVAASDFSMEGNRSNLLVEGKSIPYLDLSKWMKLDGTAPSCRTAVIVGTNERETAVLVDDIDVEREILLRPLGRRLRALKTYNGGTILPDGRLVLVLNVSTLIEHAVDEDTSVLSDSEDGSAHRPTVLVVDDSATTRALQKVILEAEDFLVLTAADGGEAWQMIQIHELDAVIADIDMPVMDGITLTNKIKSDDRFLALPVIIMTARQGQENEEAGMAAGADAYMTKSSFDQIKLVETLKGLV